MAFSLLGWLDDGPLAMIARDQQGF